MKSSDKQLITKLWRHPEFASLIPDKKSGGLAIKNTGSEIMTRAEAQETLAKIQAFLDYYDDDTITEYNRELREKLIDAVKQQMAESKQGFIYLIRADTGHYKIGRTKELKRRLNLFHVNLPFQIELIHAFPAKSYAAAETRLHHHFAAKRVNGEWFELTEEDVNLFKRLAEYDPDRGGFLENLGN